MIRHRPHNSRWRRRAAYLTRTRRRRAEAFADQQRSEWPSPSYRAGYICGVERELYRLDLLNGKVWNAKHLEKFPADSDVRLIGTAGDGKRYDVVGMIATNSGNAVKLWVEVADDVKKLWFELRNIERIQFVPAQNR